jgi:hypothetical protein
VAAQLKQDLASEVDLVVGSPGEFSVWVEGKKVAEKISGRFPEPDSVVAAVRAASS